MSDKIKGKVTKVIDGDTFEIKVTAVDPNNKKDYNSTEKIRIAGINKPELKTSKGVAAKESLEKKLDGKNVAISVKARDTYGRVVGIPKIVAKKSTKK